MKLSRQQVWDYFILIVRVLLAFILISYGWSKINGGQFGVTSNTMDLPLKDIDLFRVSWYLADHEPFKSFVGISQIITAILLIFNRTAVFGAFMAIPIWVNILIWDMSYMGLYTPFTVRLPFYLLLTFLIIWHHRDKVLPFIRSCLTTTSKFKYPWWAYLILPVLALCLELIGAIPRVIIDFLISL